MSEITGSVKKGIKNSYSLVAFANLHGKQVSLATLNGKNGTFKTLAFKSPIDDSITFVGFSSLLGEKTPAEIVAIQKDLQVVQLESGTYKLCKKGESSWEEVALDL